MPLPPPDEQEGVLRIPYKVCVYAICKNEAAFVDRFLASAAEADWVCVLDTGSTDGSAERLRERGAIVARREIEPWRFDAARNESLKLIPAEAEICCCVDLDEQFRPGWRAALERAWRSDTTRARYRYAWSFLPDGSEGHVFWADKIHRSGCYRWRGAVHEVLSYTGGGSERTVDADGVQLDHHPDAAKSRGQYLPLLELAVAENPDDDRACHYLGREYMFRGQWEKAIAVLRRHLAMPQATWADERCASLRFIARCCRRLGQDGEAERWYLRAAAEAPWLREPFVELAALLHDRGDWDGAAFFARRALAITGRPRTYICEPFAWGALPWDLLAVACWRLGRGGDALAAARHAAALAPQDERLRANLTFFERAAQTPGGPS